MAKSHLGIRSSSGCCASGTMPGSRRSDAKSPSLSVSLAMMRERLVSFLASSNARLMSSTLARTASVAPANVFSASLRLRSLSTAVSSLSVLTFCIRPTAGRMSSSPARRKRRPATSTSGPCRSWPCAPSQSWTTSPTMSPKLSSGTFGRIFSRIASLAAPGAIPAPSSLMPSGTPFLRISVFGWLMTTVSAASASQFTSRSSNFGTFLSQYCSMLARGVRAWLPENASVRKWHAKPSWASASPR